MLRLARLGFADAERADTLLGPAPDGLGLWAGGDPADGGAAAIVSALGRAADPDLALLALSRIAEPDLLGRAARRPGAAPPAGRGARRERRARRPPGREPGGLAAADRPAGAAGPAPGGRRRPRRPADRHPRRPGRGHRRGRGRRRCGWPTGATCSRSPPATWPARSASTRSRATLADLADATLPAGLAVAAGRAAGRTPRRAGSP